MASENLTKQERGIVKRCLEAIISGDFIDDMEFETLIGVPRRQAEEIAKNYIYVDEYDDNPTGNYESWLLINNTFANLIASPHGKEKELQEYVSVTLEELKWVFKKWRSRKHLKNQTSKTKNRYTVFGWLNSFVHHGFGHK